MDPISKLRSALQGMAEEESPASAAGGTIGFGEGVELARIPLDRIHPPQYQARLPGPADESRIAELAENIQAHGLLHPIAVRPIRERPGHYELIAGSRRLEAAKQLGWRDIPAHILKLDDPAALSAHISENTVRMDLDAISRAEGAMRLLILALGVPREEVLRRVTALANWQKGNRREAPPDAELVTATLRRAGLSASAFVQQHAPVLRLPEPIVQALREHRLSFALARKVAQHLPQEAIQEIAAFIREHPDDTSAIAAYIQERLNRSGGGVSRQQIAARMRNVIRRLPRDPELLGEILPLLEELEQRIHDLKRRRKPKTGQAQD